MTATTFRSALKATGLRESVRDKIVLDGIDLDIAQADDLLTSLDPRYPHRP